MNKLQGVVAVFIGAASFGILSTFVKLAYGEQYTLGHVTGIQALFGMLILWLLFIISRFISPTRIKSYARKTSPALIFISGISTGLVSILYYKSVELVPASIAIVLLMQFVWIGQLLEFIIFKVRPAKQDIVAILFILFSTVLATGLLEDDMQHIEAMGIVYGLLAATAYSVFIMVNARVGNDYPPLQKSALMISGACLLIFCLLQPFDLFHKIFDTNIWKYGLLLAVFGTVLPPALFSYGIPKIGVSLASILSAVELPVAVLMSYYVLKEPVSTLQMIGVLCILLIVILLNINKKKQKSIRNV